MSLLTSNVIRGRASTNLFVELSNQLFNLQSEIGIVAFAFNQLGFILLGDKQSGFLFGDSAAESIDFVSLINQQSVEVVDFFLVDSRRANSDL